MNGYFQMRVRFTIAAATTCTVASLAWAATSTVSLDCPVSNWDQTQHEDLHVQIDLKANTMEVGSSSGSDVFEVTDQSRDWIHAKHGALRIGINRKDGVIAYVRQDSRPMTLGGKCRLADERLF